MRDVVGIHAAKEALKIRPQCVNKLILRDNFRDSHDLQGIFQQAKNAGIKPETAALGFLDKIARGHQGVYCQVSEDPKIDRNQWDTENNQMLLALDGIEDPQNLGAIIRTAWLIGAQGIFVPKDRASPLTAAACKAASGGAEHVAVEVHSNVASPLKILKDKGFWIFGLSHKAERDLWSFKFPNKVVWVVGGEASGMRGQSKAICDEFVRLPQTDSEASYNASVAIALALGETHRQWSQSRPYGALGSKAKQ